MSWYNNESQGFIDATQELSVGGGEVIQNYYTEASDVFIPKVLNEQNGTTDTLIVNNTPNSRIFIKNSNATEKIKIEGGKLYLYYTYDFTNAPTITAGWIDVDNYITAIKQSVIGIEVVLIPLEVYVFGTLPTQLQGQLLAINTLTGTHTGQILTIQEEVAGHTGLLAELRLEVNYLNNSWFDPMSPLSASTFNQSLYNQRYFFDEATRQAITTAGQSAMGSATARFGSTLASKTLELGTSYLNYVLVGLGGIGVVVGLLFQLWDNVNDEANVKLERKILLLYEKLGDNPQNDLPKHIHKDGLLIIESTNNNLLSINNYTITLSNGGILVIEVKLIGGVLKAFVLKVKEVGNGTFSVGNIINIPKASIGGTTGDLQIQITSLISERQVLLNILGEIKISKDTSNNRRRLRDGIIKKDEFGDGLTIVYNTTETNTETGEVLQVPTIKLNLNSEQMETISGVLNIKKYVNTDTTDAITKLLLPTGATLTSDYKMSLGYKEYYSGYAYDLIMMAIKKDTYSTFTPSNYNNDYLGYFPNMGRLANVGDVKVSYTNGLLVNTSQHFTKGLIYFKNTNATKTFNMNRKFEFVTFLKFVSFNNNTTDYHLLQTGKEGLMEVDDKKLSVYIRDRKLKVQHPALVSYNTFTNGVNSVKRLTTSQSYQVREPFGALNDNIILEAENLNLANYKYRYRMLNVPYLLNNESQYINTPTAILKITDDLPNTFQPNDDSKFLSLYLNHPSNPNQAIADCIWPSVDYLMGINDNGSVMTPAQFTIPWYIKRVVLRFDVVLHRITDENPPEGGQTYIPWPVLYQETDQATLCTRVNYALSFRIVYSYDGITLINHDFTIYDVFNQGGFVNTGKTIRTGWYDNMLLPKKYLTYTFEIPNTYPNYGQKVRIVRLEIIKKTGLTYYPANASASIPYTNQPVIFLYEFNAQEYGLTETGTTQVIYDKYVTTDSLTTLSNNINLNQQYLTTLQLDLPNNSIKYCLDNTSYTLANRGSVKIYAGEQVDIPMPHPDIPFVTANFVSWAKLTNDNSTLVVGNNPSEGEINFTHFNWRFFQNSETFLTTPELTKMMPLINSNYYYDYVNVDKLLGANEIFTNSINTERLMVGSNVITTNLSAAQRAISLRTNQTLDVGNFLIDITKLYIANPTSSGSLTYNHTTKVFGIGVGAGGVGTRSEEDDITRGIIAASAGFALQWNNINKTLNVIPENIWQDLSPYATTTYVNTKDTNVSNYVMETSNFLQTQINNILPYDDTNISNYVSGTSNFLFNDYVARDAVLNNAINANDLNVSNYVSGTSNFLFNDYVARDAVLNTSINTNAYSDTKVQNYLSNSTAKTIGGILNVGTSTGGGIIKLGGIPDDSGFDLATIQNREYATNKSEIVIFKGNDISGTWGEDRIRLRAAAIAFDTYSTASTSATSESIRMFINGSGNVGIGNNAPIAPLTIGNSSLANNDGFIVLEKCTTLGTTRQFRIGLNANFQLTMGDYGMNNVAGTWAQTLKIDYASPADLLVLGAGSGTGSVGISTTDTTYKLNVNGAINATELRANGNIINNYNDTAIYNLVNTNDTNISNYVSGTSNFLFNDYVARDAVLNTKINTNDLNVSNYVSGTSNFLFNDYVARDAVLNTAINANAYSDTKVGNYLTNTLGFYGNVSGNTGIGTGTPQRILHLHSQGASSFVATKYTNITTTGGLLRGFDVGMDGSQQAMLQNYENTNMYFATNGSTRMLIQANGNIGIGTNSVPEALLHLHKPAVNTDCRITFTDDTTTGAIGRGVIIGKLSDQRGFFYNYENQPLFFGTNSTERMRIMAGGDVGIGTDNVPFAKLHLHKNSASQDVTIQMTDTTSGVTSTSGFAIGKSAAGSCFIYNYQNSDIFMGTNGTEKMRIMAGGDVGIGTNSVPFAKLHLHKNAAAQDVRIQFTDTTTGVTANDGVIVGKLSDGRGFLYNYEANSLFFGTNGTERMTIQSNGRIGIGTNSVPLQNLHIHDNITSANVGIALTDLTSTALSNRGFQIFKSNINFANVMNYESTNLQLGTAGVIRMYIGSTGNVGIGNTAGSANKLDVFGNVNTNTAYLINNTDIFTMIKGLSYFKQTAVSSVLQGGGFYITIFDILINNRWNEAATAGTNCRWTFKAQLATTNVTDSAKYVFANIFFDSISNTNFNHIQNMVGTWSFSIVTVTTNYYLRVQVQTAVSQNLLNVNII